MLFLKPFSDYVCIAVNCCRMPPDRGLSKVKKTSGTKSNKTLLTFALTYNANVLDNLKPYIIRKSLHPGCFNNNSDSSLGYYHQINGKAWIAYVLFCESITHWDRELQVQEQSIVLFVDNFSGHGEPPD